MSKNIIFIRGELVPEEAASVSVLSGMAQFGLNVFEGVRCYIDLDKKRLYAFRLDDHLIRLKQSADLLRLPLPASIETIKKNVIKVVKANNRIVDTALRITCFADGKGSWNSTGPVSYFIAPMQRSRSDVSNLQGQKACISSWQRINDNSLPPRIKLGANYMNGRFAHLQAQHDGYDLPIFLSSRGTVSEGAGACLFVVRNGRVSTPSITSSVLESITRDTFIKLSHKLGLEIEEREVDRTELYIADEVFLCGTAAEVIPLVSIDGYSVGKGRVGDLSRQYLDLYHSVVSRETVEFDHWLTDVSNNEE